MDEKARRNTDMRRSFRALSQNDKIETLYDMYMNIQGSLGIDANHKKEHIEMQADITRALTGLSSIGTRNEDVQNTTAKINAALSKQSAAWLWWRDKVIAPALAYLATLLMGAIIYGLALWVVNGKP